MFYKREEVICDQFEHLKDIFFQGKVSKTETKKWDYVGKIPKQGGGPLFQPYYTL